jgi:hypothetical protein
MIRDDATEVDVALILEELVIDATGEDISDELGEALSEAIYLHCHPHPSFAP